MISQPERLGLKFSGPGTAFRCVPAYFNPWTTNWHLNKHILCITMCSNNNINQITDISTLRFIRKLRNFVHIISMRSNGAAITLIGFVSGRIRQQISGQIRSGGILKKWIRYIPNLFVVKHAMLHSSYVLQLASADMQHAYLYGDDKSRV